MKMFGINRYVAGALIAVVHVVLAGLHHVPRVVANGHLRRDNKEQAQTIATVKKTQEAVNNLDERLARGGDDDRQGAVQAGLDGELRRRDARDHALRTDPEYRRWRPPQASAVGGGGSTTGSPSPADGAQPSPPPCPSPSRRRAQASEPGVCRRPVRYAPVEVRAPCGTQRSL